MPFQRDVLDSPSAPLGGIVGIPDSAPPSPSAPPTIGSAPTVSQTPAPGQGVALTSSGALPSSIPIAGAELAYTEYTAAVTISATTEGTANTIVTASSTIFSGSPIRVAFHSPVVQVAANAAGNFVIFVLYEDGASVGKISDHGSTSNIYLENDCTVSRRHTPTKGPHTYSIRAFRTNANSTVFAGAGGNGNYMPGYISITRV